MFTEAGFCESSTIRTCEENFKTWIFRLSFSFLIILCIITLFTSFSSSFSTPQLPAFFPSQIHDCFSIVTIVTCIHRYHRLSYFVLLTYVCVVLTSRDWRTYWEAHLWKRLNLCLIVIDCLWLFISGCGPVRFTTSTFRIFSAVTYGDSRRGSGPTKTPEACLPFPYTPGE